MTPFGGWEMPLHYGSQIDEHHEVRNNAGLFDVSHMLVLDLHGPGTRPFLRRLLANDIDKLKEPGQAIYSCMLNTSGGVIDDLVAYFRAEESYRLVLNAGNREQDMHWIRQQAAKFRVSLLPQTEFSMLAIQGPKAELLLCSVLDSKVSESTKALKRFQSLETEDLFISRTGYTGEDGFELILPSSQAEAWWQRLERAGAKPTGLGARDTLRLEAGMHLHGQDLDEHHSPLESGLGWTVAWQPETREFIGKDVLLRQKQRGGLPLFAGVLLLEKGVLRSGMTLLAGQQAIGVITSGGFSPSLNQSIALARVTGDLKGNKCEIEIRGKMKMAKLVKPVFVRNGTPQLKEIDS